TDSAFMARYDQYGELEWAKIAYTLYVGPNNSAPYCNPTSIALDEEGRTYIAGEFRGAASGLGLVADQLAFFIASFDASGSFRWAKRYQVPVQALEPVLQVDAGGNSCLSLTFSSANGFSN